MCAVMHVHLMESTYLQGAWPVGGEGEGAGERGRGRETEGRGGIKQ